MSYKKFYTADVVGYVQRKVTVEAETLEEAEDLVLSEYCAIFGTDKYSSQCHVLNEVKEDEYV